MRDKMTKIQTAHEAIVDYRTRKYIDTEDGSPEEEKAASHLLEELKLADFGKKSEKQLAHPELCCPTCGEMDTYDAIIGLCTVCNSLAFDDDPSFADYFE